MSFSGHRLDHFNLSNTHASPEGISKDALCARVHLRQHTELPLQANSVAQLQTMGYYSMHVPVSNHWHEGLQVTSKWVSLMPCVPRAALLDRVLSTTTAFSRVTSFCCKSLVCFRPMDYLARGGRERPSLCIKLAQFKKPLQ